LTVKHVGLGAHDGPKKTVGQIRFVHAKRSSRITATLDFDGSKCAYERLWRRITASNVVGEGPFRSDFGPKA
jgi:hypothetical protein